MDRINPYAVMRNTATYEAYRAHMRATFRAGQPFSAIALIVLCAWPVLFGLAAERRTPALMALGAVSVVAMAVLGAIAILRINRYRREHPIPDEWRQVPPARWPATPARMPRLP